LSNRAHLEEEDMVPDSKRLSPTASEPSSSAAPSDSPGSRGDVKEDTALFIGDLSTRELIVDLAKLEARLDVESMQLRGCRSKDLATAPDPLHRRLLELRRELRHRHDHDHVADPP